MLISHSIRGGWRDDELVTFLEQMKNNKLKKENSKFNKFSMEQISLEINQFD